jgi:menaquinone-9 beta-reductase
MDTCDVLIVGGGPAGSSCAWRLRQSGLDVVVLDKRVFPRDKVCGGWITPAVLSELEIDTREYAQLRVFQPITGFRTGCIGGEMIETNYGVPVSYGIRRREFDEYLLRRSGARLLEGVDLKTLEHCDGEWIANGGLRTRLVVGAGGHFCPVARLTGAKSVGESVVVAQEVEFEMDEQQRAGCAVSPEIPELYFCADFKGYGWCFRKQNFLNVGLGRMDQHRLSEHVAAFLRFLKSTGRLGFAVPQALLGHAYLLYDASTRKITDDGMLLIGDAAGLAYSQSGEGIRPAIESGLLAAKAILAAQGRYDRRTLEVYRTLLGARFGASGEHWVTKLGRHLPSRLIQALGERLLGMRWFARDVVIDRWFLHAGEPTLEC